MRLHTALARIVVEPPGSPAIAAHRRRNAQAPPDRPQQWKAARDRLWELIDPLVLGGDRVAVVGAGNADDVPLTRLAARAGHVDLVDIDALASRRAIRREPRRLRARLRAFEQDVTGGAVDRLLEATSAVGKSSTLAMPAGPVGDGEYDLVVGDLLYSQLVFPALQDTGLATDLRAEALERWGPRITDGVVRRLHLSAPAGCVVHLHDVAGWWRGHEQPTSVDALLRLDPDTALRQPLSRPLGCDPRESLWRLAIPIHSTALWRWPFSPGVDYLVVGTVAGHRLTR